MNIHPLADTSSCRQLAEAALGLVCRLGGMVIEMEFSRCRIVAIEIDEPRGAGLHKGVSIEAEDSRCRSLAEGLTLQVEVAHCGHALVSMEDPRCMSLYMKW